MARINVKPPTLKTRLLVSGEVLGQVNGFLTRDVGRFLLANMSRPISIHGGDVVPGRSA